MKRVILATTALVFAGGMASSDVAITGSAELGVSGEKDKDAKLHRDIQVSFALSGATDTGLSFGAAAALHEAADSRFSKKSVHISGVFGTLTLGNIDGAFDNALTETGSAGSIADNETGHPGYDGNAGLDDKNNSAAILRYDYTLGAITTSLSGEFNEADSSNSTLGAGVKWSGDLGGVGIGIGLGYQTGDWSVARVYAKDAMYGEPAVVGVPAKVEDGSAVGASLSVDMGNGLSTVLNASNVSIDSTAGDTKTESKTTHVGLGVTYTVDALTIGVNGGQKTTKGSVPKKASGAGAAAIYSLGTGVSFKVGFGGGKDGTAKKSSWSAGLAFSF